MSDLLGFLASNSQLAIRNLKYRTAVESQCGEDLFSFFFVGLRLNLKAKFKSNTTSIFV